MPDEVRILLVEDNPDDAEMALRALGKGELPGAVQHARDGEEALEFLFGQGAFASRPGWMSVRVVLLDLKLPKLDGLDVLEKVRADPRTRTLPVVVLTSSMLPADVQACYRAGANSFVVKPVEFSEHARTVKDLGTYWLRVNVSGRD